jgi:hypothetical protein
MPSYSEELLQLARRVRNDAVSLAGRDHTPDDFKSLLTRLGSAVEIFFKDHVYLGGHPRWNFVQLIDGLDGLGADL